MVVIFQFGILIIILGLCTAVYVKLEYNSGNKPVVVILIASILIGCTFLYYGAKSESFKRLLKDTQSNYSGGLLRIITIYDIDGAVFKEYQGHIDIAENNGEKIVFILEGKKHIIYNNMHNTIIVEEIESKPAN